LKSLFAVRGKISPRADLLVGLAGLAVIAVIWCFLTYGGHIKPLFLPTPGGILDGIVDFDKRDWLLPAIGGSFMRVTKALLLVILIGVPLGILMGSIPFVDALLRKMINGGKSVPTTGLLGLVVLWIGIDEKGKVVFLFLGAFFYIVILVRQAIANVNESYINVALDIGAKPSQVIRKVLLPGALPQIWDAIAVCNGIMWTYIVIAEYINSSEEEIGLGYLLQMGTRTNDSGKVFAALLIIALISAMTDWVFSLIRKRYFPW
jgi:NitT/TauT family transport system permease protein